MVKLIYNNRAKNIPRGKENLFNKWFWGNWTATCSRMKPNHFLSFSRSALHRGDHICKSSRTQLSQSKPMDWETQPFSNFQEPSFLLNKFAAAVVEWE